MSNLDSAAALQVARACETMLFAPIVAAAMPDDPLGGVAAQAFAAAIARADASGLAERLAASLGGES